MSRPSVEGMLETLRDELTRETADKAVVVSGFVGLSELSAEDFPTYEYLYNSRQYFGWLLKICEYARESSHRQIIVSRFPRQWDPPRIRVVEAAFAPNVYGPADGATGGRVLDVGAADTVRFMKNPDEVTLNVIPAGNPDTTLAVYFLGLRASSYYTEFLASQGCPPRRPIVCKVISGPGDPSVKTTFARRLRSTSHAGRHSAVLQAASDDWEAYCSGSLDRQQIREFSGGVLVPKFPTNSELPRGARSRLTAGD